MVLANRYFKGVGSTQILIFSLNTVFHSAWITAPCLVPSVFFDLCPATALLHQSLKSSNHPGNRFPQGNYHNISFIIRAIRSGVLTMVIERICHKGLLHVQKIVSQPFSGNCEPRTAIASQGRNTGKKLTCSTMCLKCGFSVEILWKSVEVEFHNLFPCPRCGTQAECGISVVIVWNQNVELVWK